MTGADATTDRDSVPTDFAATPNRSDRQ